MYLPRTTYLFIESFVHISANLFSFLAPFVVVVVVAVVVEVRAVK